MTSQNQSRSTGIIGRIKGMKLHTQILIALILGAVLGPIPFLKGFSIAIKPLGDAFINLLVMVVVPLIMASLIVGTASLGDLRKLGRIGAKTVGFYLIATALAVALGLAAGLLLGPGTGMDEEIRDQMVAEYAENASARVDQAIAQREKTSLGEFLVRIIPRNPFKAMADTDFLGIIFFALLFGITLTLLSEERRKPVVDVLNSVSDAMIVMVKLVMKVAPIGVFALIAAVAAQFGYQVLLPLLKYVTIAVGSMIAFTIFFYPPVLWLAGMSPLLFLKRYYEVMLFAFSTSSSNATLPLNLQVSEKDLGVSKEVASFVLPLGATVNMNGTAIYQGVSVIFIAQVAGWNLSAGDLLTVIVMATLASIGAAGVPGIGMVTLTLVLTQLGIDLTWIALVVGVERILDMTRTAVNVTGDTICSIVVAKTEGELAIPAEDTF
jgi:Na+/H+-dicarboxylate symporter